MSELSFKVVGAAPERHAAAPTMSFLLRVECPAPVRGIALACQIRIEPNRRDYSREDGERLLELFGDTPRWGDTVKPFLWTHVSTMIPAFEGTTELTLSVACSYELEVAGAKYLHGLRGGEIPLLFLFSGTVFGADADRLSVSRVPWDREARFRLPVSAWQSMMDAYYPNAGWLRLDRETLDALMAFKARRALPTWDGVMRELLAREDRP